MFMSLYVLFAADDRNVESDRAPVAGLHSRI